MYSFKSPTLFTFCPYKFLCGELQVSFRGIPILDMYSTAELDVQKPERPVIKLWNLPSHTLIFPLCSDFYFYMFIYILKDSSIC
jgi:hypothetical protein